MKNRFDLAVIGGGASALAAAITHKTHYPSNSVVIIEKLARVGKKILATGNGRCNLTNVNANKNDYNNPSFVSFALEMFSPQSTVDFFKSLSLLTCADSEGRVYPYSFNASNVLNCLRNECRRLGIEIVTDVKIDSVKNCGTFFKLSNGLECTKLIIATGGKSSSVHGSDGSGYALLKSLSHTIVSPKPSLVQICTDNTVTRKLKGIRVHASLTLVKNGSEIGKSKGEILFTDYGLSGIAALDLSYFIAKQKDCSDLKIKVDTAADFSKKELADFIINEISRDPDSPATNALSFVLSPKLSEVFVKECKINPASRFCEINASDIERLVDILKDFTLDVKGTKGFDMSQVTCGGADVKEFDEKTMQSKKVKNLYCCGEILDVDARCGGFNLQWAWSSGRLAGLCK